MNSDEYRHQKLVAVTRAVCTVTGVKLKLIKSSDRTAAVTRARQYAMYILHDVEGFTHEETAKWLCRTHPASLAACSLIRSEIQRDDKETVSKMDAIFRELVKYVWED